jgi:hypothetical protein
MNKRSPHALFKALLNLSGKIIYHQIRTLTVKHIGARICRLDHSKEVSRLHLDRTHAV